ncbi:MAG TPA: deiodinase-like protein, partial [Gemmataceae bacterium]|nr:deiodinase-like protein [Gemmataceae bacterium]
MHKRYGDQAEFLAIYVREAHPAEGWKMTSNDRVGIIINQPRKRDERVAVAQRCCSSLEITMPVLVDEIDDRVGHAYSGMPDRLYVIDRDGRVAYKGGRGPFGFKSRELEQSLIMLLLDQDQAGFQTAHGFPLLNDAQAWSKLPALEKGTRQPLPTWARALAAALPRTTAAMLELDFLQRAKNPLEPKLRGMMRWTAAHANHCAYSEAQAIADLRRAGMDEGSILALGKDDSKLSSAERVALIFARKMTEAADTVSDAEVSQLMGHYGDKNVAAMVLLLAYANFQDRLLLTLGTQVEKSGPLPPLDVKFSKTGGAEPSPRTPPASTNGQTKTAALADSDWLALDFGGLQEKMDEQRLREARILV